MQLNQPRSQGSLLPAPWGRVGENQVAIELKWEQV